MRKYRILTNGKVFTVERKHRLGLWWSKLTSIKSWDIIYAMVDGVYTFSSYEDAADYINDSYLYGRWFPYWRAANKAESPETIAQQPRHASRRNRPA
jgi:hypothetical protein